VLGVAVSAGFFLAMAPAAWWYWTQPPAGRVEPARFQVYPPENHEFSTSLATVSTPEMAMSPDGKNLVFTATGAHGRTALWLRPLDKSTAHPLPDTDDASYPFWSPDSRWIGFFAQGKVKRISAESGVPRDVCDVEANSWGGTWLPNDTILLSMGSGQIMRVAASGGRPTPLTEAAQGDGDGVHRWPALLPGGRHFLHYSRARGPDRRSGIDIGSLDDRGFQRRIVDTRHSAIFAPPEWLLYLDNQNLVARRFDPRRLEMLEEPVLIASQIGGSTTSYTSVSSSNNGVLAFAGAIKYSGKLTWFDRDGRALSEIEPSGDYADLSISPDGSRIAMTRPDVRTGSPDIWLYEIARETMSRFTLDNGLDASSVWWRDGSRIVYRSNRSGLTSLYRSDIADSSKAEVILDWRGAPILPGQLGHFNAVPCDITADGKTLVIVVGNRGFDLWMLPLEGEDRKPRPYQTTPFGEIHATVSPDGRWIAYASDETGRFEIYVRSFPDAGSKFQISTAGGWEPRWRNDGRELYYLAPERRLMAVRVDPGSPPRFGIATALFPVRTRLTPHPYRRNYAVDQRGERFLINTLSEDAPRPAIEVILNWQATLGGQTRSPWRPL
jgi:Tol biopolymer transport system component